MKFIGALLLAGAVGYIIASHGPSSPSSPSSPSGPSTRAAESSQSAQITTAARPSPTPAAAYIPRTEIAHGLGGSSNARGNGNANVHIIHTVQLGTGEPRHFSLTVRHVRPGGSAICIGTFGEYGQRVQAGTIYVTGLPSVTDGQTLNVALTRTGAETYEDWEDFKTIPSYRVVPPSEVPASVNVAAPSATAKPGSWMWKPTTMDRKPE